MSHPYFFTSNNNTACKTSGYNQVWTASNAMPQSPINMGPQKTIANNITEELKEIELSGQDFYHLVKVLRAKTGDMVEISDNCAFRYHAELCSIRKDSALLRVKKAEPIFRKKPALTLYLCILKREAMELAIQKTAEIGIDTIVPVSSNRVVVRVDKKELEAKAARWQQIATEASKQCKRDFECMVLSPVPIVEIDVPSYSAFFAAIENEPFLNKSSKQSLGEFLPKEFLVDKGMDLAVDASILSAMEKIAYLIGPEGGFGQDEEALLAGKGATIVNFGKNILRAETAAIYFLSVLDYLLKRHKCS